MIKFFRRIRQRMITESKFTKYLLYAIGEIILVVIGILIALGINNWNQEKGNRLVETRVLKELNRNLLKDLEEIRGDISIMDSVQISSNEIIRTLKMEANLSNKFFNNISILKLIPHFDPNKSGYEFLQSKGVDIITNDSLREQISNHYEVHYPYYSKYENERIQFKIHQMNPYLVEHFTWLNKPGFYFDSSFEISDKDYLKIKNDGSFEKFVAATRFENKIVNNRANRIIQQITYLVELINKELE